jgi:hypothetical protein
MADEFRQSAEVEEGLDLELGAVDPSGPGNPLSTTTNEKRGGTNANGNG